MIETNYYVLSQEQFALYNQYAKQFGVSIDYILDEFVDVTGPDVVWNGTEWVEVCDG